MGVVPMRTVPGSVEGRIGGTKHLLFAEMDPRTMPGVARGRERSGCGRRDLHPLETRSLGMRSEFYNRPGTHASMPKFIDSHPMGSITPETLRKLQTAPKDEYGITHHDILFNKSENKVFCVLNAPDKDSVRRHHDHHGIKCDWVEEIESTRV
jgi:hypothetical protein